MKQSDSLIAGHTLFAPQRSTKPVYRYSIVSHIPQPKGKVGTNPCYVELIDLNLLSLGNNLLKQMDSKKASCQFQHNLKNKIDNSKKVTVVQKKQENI